MILGNALTGVSLVLNAVTQAARRERAAIEGRLALGESRFEATSGVVVHAVKTGMMPILNAMAATGLVTLPGMMTGQILAGVDPVEAAKYQIMIMFVISAATALGVMLAALGGAWLITDGRHRLRLEALQLV
jgi:putative ABC transport system permease protein